METHRVIIDEPPAPPATVERTEEDVEEEGDEEIAAEEVVDRQGIYILNIIRFSVKYIHLNMDYEINKFFI